MHPDRVGYLLKKSLENLQLDYVDLYLIHLPTAVQFTNDDELFPIRNGEPLWDTKTRLEDTWKAMEKEVDARRVRSIGISNFDESQVERIAKIARIPISNIQVECQIYRQQKQLREVCSKHKITMVAYGPFGSPGRKESYETRGWTYTPPTVLNDPVVADIAKKHGKAPSHVLLRFLLQEGIAVIPKSSTPGRIHSNIDVFDFCIDEEDMKRLRDLDKGDEGSCFDIQFPGIDKHPECPKAWRKEGVLRQA